MRYSIGQVAKKLGLTAHTLRYYDKEGLLPFVRKGSSGARDNQLVAYKHDGFWQCMDTQREKEKLEQQMAVFRQYMEKIDFKIAYYTEAVANGSVDIYKRNKCLAAERERLFGHK